MNKIHSETNYSLSQYKLLNALADYRERAVGFFVHGHEPRDIRNVKQRRENLARMKVMGEVRVLAKMLHDNRGKVDSKKVVKLKTR